MQHSDTFALTVVVDGRSWPVSWGPQSTAAEAHWHAWTVTDGTRHALMPNAPPWDGDPHPGRWAERLRPHVRRVVASGWWRRRLGDWILQCRINLAGRRRTYVSQAEFGAEATRRLRARGLLAPRRPRLTQTTISRMETGRLFPTLDEADVFAELGGVEFAWLVSEPPALPSGSDEPSTGPTPPADDARLALSAPELRRLDGPALEQFMHAIGHECETRAQLDALTRRIWRLYGRGRSAALNLAALEQLKRVIKARRQQVAPARVRP